MNKLWHDDALQFIPDAQLAHLHRRLCAMRGNGYGRGASLGYIWRAPYRLLYLYHLRVLEQMRARGWNPSPDWQKIGYRGKKAAGMDPGFAVPTDLTRYPEHDNAHYLECVKRAKAQAKKSRDIGRISDVLGI